MTIKIPTKKVTLNEAQELRDNTLGFISKTAQEMGELSKIKIGFWDIYFVNHPEFIQHIFLDNWKNYGRETFQFNNFARVTGNGLLTTHGEYWQQQRRKLQPGFHRSKMDGMANHISAAVHSMHNRWDHMLTGNQTIGLDIDKEMLRLGLEIVGAALFSLDFSEESAELSQEILEMMRYIVYRSQNLLALPTFVPTRRNRQFKRTLSKVNKFIFQLITDRQLSGKSHDDLLDLLLSGQKVPLPEDSLQIIRDEIITMIIAGYETVATGMGWMWSLLGHHPAVKEKICAEIADTTFQCNAQLLSNLPYTTAAIQETFRLYPPSWLITRRSIKEDQIGNFAIPAGSIIVMCPYSMHRSESFWDRAGEFDPERWINPDKNRHKFAYFPFGGGPHLCIGQPLAMLEAGLVLTKTLQKYKIAPVSPTVPDIQGQVTLRPKSPHYMHISKR